MKPKKEIFMCAICSREFTTKRGRAAHLRTHNAGAIIGSYSVGVDYAKNAFKESMEAEYGKMTPELEIKTFTKHGVAITVKIDYRNKEISLVDANQSTYAPKQFLFNKRGLEYMQGWKNILDSMKNAIERAESMLEEHQDKAVTINAANVGNIIEKAKEALEQRKGLYCRWNEKDCKCFNNSKD